MAVGDPLIFLFNPQNIVIMGLRVRRVKRAFGFDKTQTEKYVIVPDRATIVSFGDLCEQVALISGINLGMGSGHRIQLGSLDANFYPTRSCRTSGRFRHLHPLF